MSYLDPAFRVLDALVVTGLVILPPPGKISTTPFQVSPDPFFSLFRIWLIIIISKRDLLCRLIEIVLCNHGFMLSGQVRSGHVIRSGATLGRFSLFFAVGFCNYIYNNYYCIL